MTILNFKTLNFITIIIVMFATAGCSLINIASYHPDIHQGNYMSTAEILKIKTGMTKYQVVQVLGTPMIKDPFGSNTWYYISSFEASHKAPTQETIKLIFNTKNVLCYIETRSSINSVKNCY